MIGYTKSKPGKKWVRAGMERMAPAQRQQARAALKTLSTPGGVAKNIATGAGRVGLIGAGLGLGAYGLKRALSPSSKQAAAFGITPDEFEQMQKEALGGAIMAGLKGAGQFIQKAAPGVRKAFMGAKGQGLQVGKGLQAMKTQAGRGVQRASRWGAKNPGAAAALGTAGLGTAALAGRATA